VSAFAKQKPKSTDEEPTNDPRGRDDYQKRSKATKSNRKQPALDVPELSPEGIWFNHVT
jgi:hypothetical protein